MKLERLVSVLMRVTYKPGYQFFLGEMEGGRFAICLLQNDLQDVRDPSRKVTLRFIGDLIEPETIENWSVEDVLLEVRKTAALLEVHEMHEWLCFEGNRLHDPHDRKAERAAELALGGRLAVRE